MKFNYSLMVFILIFLLSSCSPSLVKGDSDSGTDSDVKGTLSLSGNVTLSDGTPLAGARINISGVKNSSVVTGSSGEYAFSGLPAGTYYCSVSNGTYILIPASLSTTIALSADMSNVNFICVKMEAYYEDNSGGDSDASTVRVAGFKVKDSSGTVRTILNEKFYGISEIQGAAHISPYEGERVTNVIGTVTGFIKNMGSSYEKYQDVYIQSIYPDKDIKTSEGIKLYTSNTADFKIGDIVVVTEGRVEENSTDPDTYESGYNGNLSRTQILCSGDNIITLYKTGKMPTPVKLVSDRAAVPDRICDDAAAGDVNNPGTIFDPENDAIDYWESLEHMYIEVYNPEVVAPTNYSEISIIPGEYNGITYGKMRSSRGGVMFSSYDDYTPSILKFGTLLYPENYDYFPKLKVGAKFTAPARGVLDYQRGVFEMYATVDTDIPAYTQSSIAKEVTGIVPVANALTVAGFNLENFAVVNEYGQSNTAKINGLASEIKINLKMPDIVGLIEIQDDSSEIDDGMMSSDQSLNALVAALGAPYSSTYKYTYINPIYGKEGGAPGANIRVALLYNSTRVSLPADAVKGPSDQDTSVILKNGEPSLTYNPGRIGVDSPSFSSTRRPLVAEFLFNGNKIFIVLCHLSSKSGDYPPMGNYQPAFLYSEEKRWAQAKLVSNFVDSILSKSPSANVIVLGDLNDYHFSKTLTHLKGDSLINLIDRLPANERYTYIHDGKSQTLDHILVSSNLFKKSPIVDVVHVHTEFFYVSSTDQSWSDHEPVLAQFNF